MQKKSDSISEQQVDLLQEKVAELTEAKQSLAGTRLLVEAMLENIPDRIYFKDTQSRFIRVSNALVKRLKVSHPDDVIGKTDFDFHPPERARRFFEDEQQIIQTGEPLINKIEKGIGPKGEPTWTSTTKVPLRNDAGVIVGIVGINRDITDLTLAEQKIESMNRELHNASRQAGMAEVATGVLHNVGNVLNSVNVAVGVLSDRINHSKTTGVTRLAKLFTDRQNDLARFLTEDERGRQIPVYLKQLSEHIETEQADLRKELKELVMNVEHIKEIVATQQSYARVMGASEVVNLHDVMEDAIKIHGSAYERHGIKLIRDYDTVPAVALDKHKVMQILINFLSNAKYACDAGPQDNKSVSVRIKLVGDERVRLEVQDTGVGIAPENLTRIFSQGFTTRKGGHGFGLHSGLLAAKELGGALTAESNGSGQGATFVLELPLATAKNGQPKS